MSDFSALSQAKQSHIQTPSKLNRLVRKYFKVVYNIETQGMDYIVKEIDQYVVDEEITDFEKLSYVEYWKKVSDLIKGL